MMVACSSEDTALKNTPAAGPQMQFTATIAAPGSGATTRTAYTESGTDINVTWSVGDEIALIHNGVKDVATVKTVNADGSATIAGIITGATNEADVQLYYPSALVKSVINDGPVFDNDLWGKISTQDGTLKYIQDNLDFRSAKGQLSVNETSATLKEAAKMYAMIAIWKLKLKDNASALLEASKVSIEMGSGDYRSGASATPSSPKSELTIATTVAPAVDNVRPITIEATVGNNTYVYKQDNVDVTPGKYYQSTVTMAKFNPMLAIPLTVEAITAGSVVVTNPPTGMKYSLNGGPKTAVTSDAINVGVGDKVAFYCNGFSNSSFPGTVITGSGEGFKCKVYGNIMSLRDETGFATTTPSLTTSCFKSLFNSNSYLTDASGLLLPATDLTNATYCYKQMFDGCTGLTTAPVLPATTLTMYCYQGMFYGCTSLTTAPTLPATTLALSCYSQMFYGCKGLTTAPALPATTLANNCYYCMFQGCTGLTTAPALPATTMAQQCYQGMFDGCTSLTTAPELKATTMKNGCYQNMFYGCKGLTTAPALPATTLTQQCYRQMFYGCISLTTAPELKATTLANNCYDSMFYGCTSLTATPKLPATSLSSFCYMDMFKNCTSLTKAYVKANYDNQNCMGMFNGCTNATTSTFYSDDAANWKSGFSANLGNWQEAAYPVTQ